MEARLEQIDLGYSPLEFTELVERELKGSPVTQQEKGYLNANISAWKAELVICKKRTEMQCTSSKARVSDLNTKMYCKDITYLDYVKKLNVEKVWRVNAARFLQQIETKIQRINVKL